jgi:hypothetical protein
MRLSSEDANRSRRPPFCPSIAWQPRAVSHIRTIDAAAEPTAPSALAEAFYAEALRELSKLGLPFLLAGTYALSVYTGIVRGGGILSLVESLGFSKEQVRP